MSIDLSRVTGISDSRGVITEIRDSLGRVIWSANTVSPYFIPTADVSNQLSVYPEGSAAYKCVGEKVADGDATYIYPTGSFQDVVLVFSANLPTDKIISAINIVMVYKVTNGETFDPAIRPDFVFNGVRYTTKSFGLLTTGNGEYTVLKTPIVDAQLSSTGDYWIHPTNNITQTLPIILSKTVEKYLWKCR